MDIKLEACPLCGNLHSTPFLTTEDYLVTRKSFNLVQCDSCTFVFTNPRPSFDHIGKYYESGDYISHVNDNSSFKNILYSVARNLMLHKKFYWMKSLNPVNTRLLDYGCGTGSFLNFLSNKKWEVWGVEPNDTPRKHLPDNLSNRVFGSLAEIPVSGFEIITLWHVLEHLHDIHGTIEDLISSLSPAGWLVMALPNFSCHDAQHYKNFWAGYDVPRHLSHFTPVTMKLLAKKHRLQLVKTIPLVLDAYYICMLSEKYCQGLWANGLYHAFKSNQRAAKNPSNYSSLVYVLKR